VGRYKKTISNLSLTYRCYDYDMRMCPVYIGFSA
jgi:hypothetical protein